MIYEQLDIFSVLETDEQYSWDNDINEIHKMLIRLAKDYRLEITADNFSIWSHVPQYGYRMEFEIKICKEHINDKRFIDEINKIVRYAENKKIELSPMWGAVYFFGESETARLMFFSTFMDRKRRKKK